LRKHFNLKARQFSKFRRAATLNCEIIGAHLLHIKPFFDPPLKKVVRGPASPLGGALVKFDHSLTRVKILVRSIPRGRNMVFRNMRFGGGVKISVYNLVRKRPKFAKFISFNAKLTAFDKAVYRLSIFLFSLEIFAVKLESFRKTY